MLKFISYALIWFLTSVSHVFPQTSQQRLSAIYDSLAHPVPDENRAFAVQNVTITRGGQEIKFLEGTLTPFIPVNGHMFGAFFTGKGTFTVAPPTSLEQKEFERQTSETLVDGRFSFHFDQSVLLFQDSIYRELAPLPVFVRTTMSRKDQDNIAHSLRYATDPDNTNVVFKLLTEMFESDPQPYLFADFFLPKKRDIFLTYDLRRFEEVTIHQEYAEEISGSVFWLQLVNSFHLPDEYAAASEYRLVNEDKRRYSILQEIIDLSIETGGHTTGHADLTVHAHEWNTATATFELDRSFHVDSLSTPQGQHLPFLRSEKGREIFALFPRQDSSEFQISVQYSGKFLEPYRNEGIILGSTGFVDTRKINGSFYKLSSSIGWYPSIYLDRTVFDVTYRYPKDMLLASAGRKIDETVMGDQKVAHYKTEPTIISSFSLGYYESQTFQEGNGEIPVTIVDEKGGSPEEVALDVANSFKLYTNLFGGAPYARITVTTGPLKHGQAFQEFIHLPWFEEPMKYGKKLVYLGRAHEVAHAWWGHGVNAKSYHDAWLNEAFANYSSLLYARYVLGKDEALFDKIREWREEILGRSHFGIGSGPTLGSIFLGYRASSRQTPRDYAISTYEKGALVLHMLRMMLIDFTTLQESTFKSLMAEFYQKYKGKSASTDDFQKLTEHYFGSDMTWFFDQWVYGTEIPTLKCTKSVTKNAAGHYDLKLTIEQKDVSRPFKIYLPLRIKYKDGSVFRGRILIDQMKTEYPYEVDSEPEEITFNIMESVLCKIEE